MTNYNNEKKENFTLTHNGALFSFSENANTLKWDFYLKDNNVDIDISLEDDYELYRVFYRLINDIKIGLLYTKEEIKKIYNDDDSYQLIDYNTEAVNSSQYKSLFHNNTIVYQCPMTGDVFNIVLEDNFIRIKFDHSVDTLHKSFTFKRSDYKTMNCYLPFFRCFNELKIIDFSTHQMNMYDLTKKITY